MRRLSERSWVTVGLIALLVVVVVRAAGAWRYFAMFMADHGWYLQVALRVSRGAMLYRDVAWAYGPLPAQVLAALFRWRGPDASLASAINTALALLAIPLTYAAVRQLLPPRRALFLTGYAALVGTYVGGDLIHWHLHIYTQAAAWGLVASLAALLAALRWSATRWGGWLILAGWPARWRL